MLASHGALLSDERLPLVVLDMRKLKTLEGRVLAHGEEEAGKSAGRHYLLLEGTDAKVHLIYYTPEMEEARSRGKLRPNRSSGYKSSLRTDGLSWRLRIPVTPNGRSRKAYFSDRAKPS